MKCWKCGTEQETSDGKVSFRAVCDRCNFGLHSCCNCRFYQPGRANDCLIPGTEFVSDREANNFCDEFKAATTDWKPPKKDFGGFDGLFRD